MTKIKVRSYQMRSLSAAFKCKLSSSTQCLVSQIVKFILEITFLSEISIQNPYSGFWVIEANSSQTVKNQVKYLYCAFPSIRIFHTEEIKTRHIFFRINGPNIN